MKNALIRDLLAKYISSIGFADNVYLIQNRHWYVLDVYSWKYKATGKLRNDTF